MGEAIPLFNPNDGITGRNGGPYLDEVQAQQDEIRRAKVEQREPDLENPGPNAGIQLSTAAQMVAALTVTNNPSMEIARGEAIAKAYKDAHANLDTVVVRDEIPDTSDQPSNADLEKQTFNTTDPNAPSSESDANDKTGDKAVELVGPGTDNNDGEDTDSVKVSDPVGENTDPFGPASRDADVREDEENK